MTALPIPGHRHRRIHRKNIIYSFVLCSVLVFMVFQIRFLTKGRSASGPIIEVKKENKTKIPVQENIEIPPPVEEKYEIQWKQIDSSNNLLNNGTFTEQGTIKRDLKVNIDANETIFYTKLQNVCVFPNSNIENKTFTFSIENTCQSNADKSGLSDLPQVSVEKAVFISHNTYSSMSDRLLYEIPLISLIPSEERSDSVLLITTFWKKDEIGFAKIFGYKDTQYMLPRGICAKELIILSGPFCHQISFTALSKFKTELLSHYPVQGKNPRSVVLATTDSERNDLFRIKSELDQYFSDVTFMIPPTKYESVSDRLKFWSDARVVITSINGTNGNEIWMIPGTTMLILSDVSHCFHSQISHSFGVNSVELLVGFPTFQGLRSSDILMTIEEYLVKEQLTIIRRKLGNDADDIF